MIDKDLNCTKIMSDILDLLENDINFNEIILFLILIKGNYLKFLIDIDEIQNRHSFFIMGSKKILLKSIKDLRVNLGLKSKDFSLDREKILPIFENGDEWLRIITCGLFKKKYYNSLSSLLEALSRRFTTNYFHNSLQTNFLIKNNFYPPYGYKINWNYINKIINIYRYKVIIEIDENF